MRPPRLFAVAAALEPARRDAHLRWRGRRRHDFTGDRFEITYDGRRRFALRDETFPGAGRVGIWSKADSVTEFDHFREEEAR